MDDKDFDKIIRNKVGDYSHPEFDEGALNSFKARMSAETPTPWYQLYRGEILTAAAVSFIAVLLFWFQFDINQRSIGALSDQLRQVQDQNNQLQQALSGLQLQTDTVRIVEYRQSTEDDNALRDQIRRLQQQLRRAETGISPELNTGKQLIYAGTKATLPEETLRFLAREHQLVQNGDYFFILMDKNIAENETPSYIERDNRITSRYTLPEYVLVLDSIEDKQALNQELITNTKKIRIPARYLREVEEKTYGKGIGIEIGPSAEIYRAIYSPGSGGVAYGTGILANFITSPKLSIETGAIYNSSEYSFGYDEVNDINLPPPGTEFGEFMGIDAISQFIEFPVNLKYRHRISATGHLIGGIGISTLLYTRQEFEYQYNFTDGGLTFPVETSVRKKDANWMLGTVNLSLGVSARLNNGKRIETMVFYRPGLSNIGYEETEAQFAGIRASYFFQVK